jgi:diguanylate cyclase (GGDEF)-like protein
MTHSFDQQFGCANSRYASQLSKGTGEMRFPPDLEREYHGFYLSERRSHVRSFNLIMSVLTGCAFASSLLSHDLADSLQRWRLGAIALTYLLLLWICYSRRFDHIYLASASRASLLIAVVGAIEIANRIALGHAELLALLTTYSIGLYFLAGILFHAASRANVVLIVAFMLALALLGEPPSEVAYLTGILAATALIGGVSFRYQGVRFRRSFLERGLIAELAARDGLTGLKNRRAFDEHLTRAWQQALRDRRQLGLLMIDVDCFKNFNDRYGHQAGDEALQKIATVVSECTRRPLDLAARYGGEELTVILFDVTRTYVVQIAEQIRAAVENLGIEHLDSTAANVVTITIGIAIVHPTLERSPEGSVQLADEALYSAKHAGRNRVAVFESEYDGLSTGTFQRR